MNHWENPLFQLFLDDSSLFLVTRVSLIRYKLIISYVINTVWFIILFIYLFIYLFDIYFDQNNAGKPSSRQRE